MYQNTYEIHVDILTYCHRYIYTFTQLHTYTLTHIHTYTHTHVHTYTYAHTHLRTYAHTSCMGASCKTVAIDAASSRTVQSNAWRKHFNVRWLVMGNSRVNTTTVTETCGRNLCDDWNDSWELGSERDDEWSQNLELGSERADGWPQKLE